MIMKYNQYTVNGVKVNLVEGDIKDLRLLQPDKSKVNLDQYRYTDKLLIPKAIINGGYGDDKYNDALGRTQGDVKQNTSSWKEQKYLGFAIDGDTYKCGELEYWDIGNSICGFTPALICIKDKQDVKMCSTALSITYEGKLNLATAITFMGVLEDKKTVHLITAERGLSGAMLLKWAKEHWTYDFLCELDGGGSSQMMVNGKYVQNSTDSGGKRRVYNALALIENEQPQPKEEIKLLYPCKSGGDTQEFKPNQHYGIDFGYKSGHSDDILASEDGIVEYEGFWTDIIGGKEYKPIMIILKHDISEEYDYYTLYTHLASTCINKGDKVAKGQKIGVKGNTGYSGGKHLHFQLMRMPKGTPLTNWNKNAINPQPFLYRTKDQEYFYQGLVEIPLEDEPIPEPEDKDKIIAELKQEIEKLKAEKYELFSKYEIVVAQLEKAQNKIDRARKDLNE